MSRSVRWLSSKTCSLNYPSLCRTPIYRQTTLPLQYPRRYSSTTPPKEPRPRKWYPIPLALGTLLLVGYYYSRRDGEPKRGGITVTVLPYLPLKPISRAYGWFSSLPLPMLIREPSLKLYAYIFGANLDEIDPPELSSYTSLTEFFNRRLKPGARPISENGVVSPADGRLLHCGIIEGESVEQVKGMTYSLDALLGVENGEVHPVLVKGEGKVVDEREFASVNGIEYTLKELIGSEDAKGKVSGEDVSVAPEDRDGVEGGLRHDAGVAKEMGAQASLGNEERPKPRRRSSTISSSLVKPGNALYFAVVYLAPGDYHRFHSPVSWVVERRRHFVGELYSVSPWLAKRMENLFVLNERVSLLGRWRYGFFSMVPVGATNVGSIKINFDQDLHTNARIKRRNRPPPSPGIYAEATYRQASPLLGGQPVQRGEEMGGFLLGSTIVLVFEAPSNFEWTKSEGDKVKVGEIMGDVRVD